MKKIKDVFGYDDLIHCETQEQANNLSIILHSQGFKWCNGLTYLQKNSWPRYKEKTCYQVIQGGFAGKDWFESDEPNSMIFSFEQFLGLMGIKSKLYNYINKV